MATERLQVVLELVNGQYKREAKEAATATGQIGDAAATSSSRLKGMAIAGVAVAGAALVKLGRESLTAASNLNESINAVGVVFEDSQDKIHAWGETAAEAAGLSKNAFNEAVVPIGALLKNFGFDVDASADAVIALTQRAADLGSTLNIDTSVALDKFRAGLAGEAEPLKAFGVDVSVAAIQAEALSLGLIKTGEALTTNARAQAAMSIIMRSTDDYAGDFANTLGTSLPNQAKKLTAQIDNLKARLGQGLLPAALRITSAFGEMTEEGGFLEDVLLGLGTAAGEAGEGLGDLGIALNRINTIMGEAAPGFDTWAEFWNFVGFNIPDALSELGTGLEFVTRGLEDEAAAIEAAARQTEYMADATKDDLIPAVGDLIPAVEEAVTPINRLSTAQRLAGDATRHHFDALVSLANFLASRISPVLAANEALKNLATAQDTARTAAEEHGRKSEEFALAQIELALAVAEAEAAFGTFGVNAEDSIDAVAQALGISNETARIYLDTLGLLDGMTVTSTIILRQINLLEEGVIPEGQGWNPPPRSTSFPILHSGGIVPGPRGSDQLIVAQGGEGILSLAQMSRGGSTSNAFGGTVIVMSPSNNLPQDLQYGALLANHATFGKF